MSFEEPTRFIFSHSALREGWDNPNVFQICTLRHSNSTTAKRQEVGRGLRICVDKHGTRMDAELLGEDVHEVATATAAAIKIAAITMVITHFLRPEFGFMLVPPFDIALFP